MVKNEWEKKTPTTMSASDVRAECVCVFAKRHEMDAFCSNNLPFTFLLYFTIIIAVDHFMNINVRSFY